jgi:hypothetical protein
MQPYTVGLKLIQAHNDSHKYWAQAIQTAMIK